MPLTPFKRINSEQTTNPCGLRGNLFEYQRQRECQRKDEMFAIKDERQPFRSLLYDVTFIQKLWGLRTCKHTHTHTQGGGRCRTAKERGVEENETQKDNGNEDIVSVSSRIVSRRQYPVFDVR